MEKYLNRHEAGLMLADELQAYLNQPDTFVFALPRGGVPVGFEVARALHLPLDVLIVRKLGVPTNPEFAFGAIASNGVIVLNQAVIQHLRISSDTIARVTKEETKELKRREEVYRGHQSFPTLQGKTILLVDDGIATGYTMKAAISALREQKPAKIVVASPVAARDTYDTLSLLVEEIVCPLTPEDFEAVGLWYQHFSQTTDEEVRQLLETASYPKID